MRTRCQSNVCVILHLQRPITANQMFATNYIRAALNYTRIKLVVWNQCYWVWSRQKGRTKHIELVAELTEIKFFWDATRYVMEHIYRGIRKIFLLPSFNWHGVMSQNTLIFIKMWMWISMLFFSVYFPSVLPLRAFHLPFSLLHFISASVIVAVREEVLQANTSFGSITLASHVKK